MFIGDVGWGAEVADTPEKRRKGLAERDSLAELTGMVFVVPRGQTSGFWMAGMKFALDLVWISADCTVSEITRDAPPVATSTLPSEIAIYKSAVPTAFTFEINAGEVELYGIELGDRVQFQGFSAGC